MVFPYLKGFDIIKCDFSILFLMDLLCIQNIQCDLTIGIRIGIRALSLAKEGKNFLLFLQNFSREEKEGGALQVHI
jgi:hypothetical protein